MHGVRSIRHLVPSRHPPNELPPARCLILRTIDLWVMRSRKT